MGLKNILKASGNPPIIWVYLNYEKRIAKTIKKTCVCVCVRTCACMCVCVTEESQGTA